MKPLFISCILISIMLFFGSFIKDSKNEKHKTKVKATEVTSTSYCIKPQMGGLVIRSISAAHLYPRSTLQIFNNLIVEVNWSDLQPDSSYKNKIDTSLIQTSLAYIDSLASAAAPVTMGLKIRVLCGIYTPDWIKALPTVGTIPWIYNGTSSTTLPRFWKDSGNNALMAKFGKLMSLMAAKYDTDQRVLEVTASPCVITTDEPFLLKCGGDGTKAVHSTYWSNCRNLDTTFYSNAKHFAANERAIDTMKNYWVHTRISECFGPYEILELPMNMDSSYFISEDSVKNVAQSDTLINYFVNQMGTLAVIGNNGLRDYLTSANGYQWSPALPGPNYQVYSYMQSKFQTSPTHPGVYFQTAAISDNPGGTCTTDTTTHSSAGDLWRALQYSPCGTWSTPPYLFGAGEIEMPIVPDLEPTPPPNTWCPYDTACRPFNNHNFNIIDTMLEHQALQGIVTCPMRPITKNEKSEPILKYEAVYTRKTKLKY
jgi:hypothetical protein